ncbi:hypothetical protein J4470_04205 [Candidatus Woesearchaeota archaeon]|nr:hypothetical protein [Candidatus Woesearchaeota archaeon]
MDTSFFKEYDIRGVIDKEITLKTAEMIGKAFGTLVKAAPVVVGYDIRQSSEKILGSFINGLKSTGCDISVIGKAASPVLYFNAWNSRKVGAMITASHNPAEYTGFKFVEKNGCSFVDQYKDLRKIYAEGNFIEGKGTVTETDGYAPYLNFLKSVIRIRKPVKVAVECLYASAGTILPKLYEELGMEVVPSHCEPKPDFNKERPEPKGDNLKAIGELIRKNKAAFGVGFDGDCDRSVIIDDKGREISGSQSSGIFIKHILPKNKGGSVVVTIDCHSELKALTESLGGKFFWSEVGHGFIGSNVYKHKAVYGGEMSSHMWFERYPFSDGFLCGLKMAELLSETDEKLSDMVDELNFAPMLKEYTSCDTNEKKEKVIAKLVENHIKMPGATKTRDGVKFFLNETEWVLLRKSNNLPEICLVFEAKDEARYKELHSKYRKIIDDTIAGVN